MINSIVLIRHILGAIDRIESYTKDITEEEFMENFLVQDGVIRNLEIIGEASGKIDASIKNSYSHIPWKAISGMRNKLVHEYFGVDLNAVWVAITNDIVPLKVTLIHILKSLED